MSNFSTQIGGWGKIHDSRFAEAAKQDALQSEFRQKLNMAVAVLNAPFVRQMDLGAAAKTAFKGKSERRSVQHRLAGNDSFKR